MANSRSSNQRVAAVLNVNLGAVGEGAEGRGEGGGVEQKGEGESLGMGGSYMFHHVPAK